MNSLRLVIGIVSSIAACCLFIKIADLFKSAPDDSRLYLYGLFCIFFYLLAFSSLYGFLFRVESQLEQLKKVYKKDWDDEIDITYQAVQAAEKHSKNDY